LAGDANEFDGELTGELIQAVVTNAESITFGTGSAQPRLGRDAVGRLADRVRGRDSSVADLVAAVRAGAGVVVLHGGGGAGKTTLALTTASAVRDEIPGWWVDATNCA
jgi:Mrp family chromosome partitioning ATPase